MFCKNTRKIIQPDAAIRGGAHQCDTPARRIHFRTKNDVGWARLQAHPTMNALVRKRFERRAAQFVKQKILLYGKGF
jgi:hypothetical protein